MIRNLPEAINEELRPFSRMHKFKGRGQQDTVVLNYTGLLKLVMALPGNNAKIMRTKFAEILKRYFAGDSSLIAEIEHNEASSGAVHEAAREALHDAPVMELDNGSGAVDRPKRKRDTEEMLEEDPGERKIRLRKMEMEIEQMHIDMQAKKKESDVKYQTACLENLERVQRLYTNLCTGGIIDDRARVMFKDDFLNLRKTTDVSSASNDSNQRLITDSSKPKELTISDLALKMQIRLAHGQLTQAGRIMARLYREKYNEDPQQVERYVDGAARMVKRYTTDHQDLMEQAIKEASEKV